LLTTTRFLLLDGSGRVVVVLEVRVAEPHVGKRRPNGVRGLARGLVDFKSQRVDHDVGLLVEVALEPDGLSDGVIGRYAVLVAVV